MKVMTVLGILTPHGVETAVMFCSPMEKLNFLKTPKDLMKKVFLILPPKMMMMTTLKLKKLQIQNRHCRKIGKSS